MGLWNDIIDGVGRAVNILSNPGSSEDYTKSFGQAQESIDKTRGLVDQYTGNQGLQNSLQQGIQNAGQLANAAVGTSTNAARNAGMSKAQAAAMGNQNANANFVNTVNAQQGNAMNMGQNAISAQQGVTSAQQGQSSQAATEKNNMFGRANTTLGVGKEAAQNIGNMLNIG